MKMALAENQCPPLSNAECQIARRLVRKPSSAPQLPLHIVESAQSLHNLIASSTPKYVAPCQQPCNNQNMLKYMLNTYKQVQIAQIEVQINILRDIVKC